MVGNAAQALRKLSMARADGELIGSEEDLVALLGVSRPTLRQASAHLIQENLITVRRGVGGGYFACVPDSMTVSRMASLYLKSREVGLVGLLEAIRPIRGEIAALAARNSASGGSEALALFLRGEEDDLAAGRDASYRQFLVSDREFGRIIGALSANDLLGLFLSIIYDLASFTRREEDVYLDHPERVEAYRRRRVQMARAILDADEEVARIASRRCSDLIIEWMQADAEA